MLSPQWLDELRQRITLSGVISRTTKLQRAGREWKACCPFHNEKSPSFTVNDEKGFYHCFGCGAHGDAIRWMTDQRGLSFMDAVKELASEAGMEVPAPDPRMARQAEQRAGLHDVTAAAQGSSRDQFVMTSYYRDDIGIPEMGVVGRELWRQSGLGPDDMQMAVLYDHFTPYVLMQLEELGFCGRGEAKDFVADGAIEVGGRLPLNTHGGQLGEAYIHGMNGIAEAVRQVRNISVNPVPDVDHVLVTAGTGVPTSGLVLSR